MKIEIHTHDLKRDINIALPTTLVFSNLSAHILSSAVKKESGADALSADTIQKIFIILRKFKKAHPDFVLVEVNTSGGEHIVINL